MPLSYQTIGNRLTGWSGSDWSVSMSSPPNALLETLASAIYGAEQEMRSHCPRAFSQPRQKRVAAPASIAPTIGGSGATLTVAGIPSAGVTVLLTGATGGHNRILSLSSGTTWNLVRAHEGGDGATTGTVWDDTWIVADGDAYECLLGEVKLDGVPLLRCDDEADMARRYNLTSPAATRGYGLASGSAYRALTPRAGTPLFYWDELVQASVNAAPVQWLRLFPMPSAAATLSARVVLRAPEVDSSTVFASATRKVAAPGGKEQELFMPIAEWHWAQTPFSSPSSTQMRALETRYRAAVEKLIYLA